MTRLVLLWVALLIALRLLASYMGGVELALFLALATAATVLTVRRDRGRTP